MQIESASCTHVGRRSNNEDSHCAVEPIGFFAVADGMGGYEGGEVASRVAIETLERFYRRNAADDDVTWPFAIDPAIDLEQNMVATGVRMADANIAAQRTGRLSSMGSTVATLVVRGGRVVVGHVGDSRVYRARGGRLEALTRDHSLYEEMLAMGTKVGPRSEFPHANVITRALGMKAPVRVDTRVERARVGDVYLLCTDGLYDGVSAERMAAVLSTMTAKDAAETLVQEAFVNGSKDNITAVVVAVVG
ncbi:MAG: protein phosphatase 2C domain-containing protein [Deltaproteobacteria bacterium]|nr:protein phosphatase 2C domain-containing protein [Myxococcales bacterium]MDP3215832.1 protein phosphatase 2C domain-containing protein [Deltaproteobacteria bacterium]